MPFGNQKRINDAVRECIRQSCESNSIVTGIAKFIAELRNSSDWQEHDIRAVESSARHLLARIVDSATFPNDVNALPNSEMWADSNETNLSG